MSTATTGPQNPLIDELEEALSHSSAERRLKTLRRVTDLFVFGSARFSGEQIAVFDDVFEHLIAKLEHSARVSLAMTLAGIPVAPPKAIQALAFDDAIDVAGPVLTQSSVLDNVALVANAKSKSQQHLLAISRRDALAETVTDVLVERGNRDVALSVVQNKGAQFSDVGFIRLVKRSAGDEELALCFGRRREVPRHYFLKLLAAASDAVRASLEAAHPEYKDRIQDAVAGIAATVQIRAAHASHDYAAAQALVGSLHAAGELTELKIEEFARARKFEETAAALATMSALPLQFVERAMLGDREDAIVIVAKAIGFSWRSAKALLLLCAGEAGMSERALEAHRANFERLKRPTAQKVIEFQRQAQTGRV
jgi:uncharacterized protein (DUF2336 family)